MLNIFKIRVEDINNKKLNIEYACSDFEAGLMNAIKTVFEPKR